MPPAGISKVGTRFLHGCQQAWDLFRFGNTVASMDTLIEANLSSLQQGIDLLEGIPREVYRKSCPEVFGSTIGGHLRHNLDHLAAFRDGYAKGVVDYDARDREPAIETDPAAARLLMESLRDWFSGLPEAELDRELSVRMDEGGHSSSSRTTVRRELQFLLSHTIHHYALIVSIAARYGVDRFPDGFGIAPSTLTYHQSRGA